MLRCADMHKVMYSRSFDLREQRQCLKRLECLFPVEVAKTKIPKNASRFANCVCR